MEHDSSGTLPIQKLDLTNNDLDIEPATQASLSLDDLLNEEVREQPWLVDKLIPIGAFTLVSGQPYSYKSWFTYDLALSVAQGKSLYGVLPVTQSGVLYVDEEAGKQLLHRQLDLLRAPKGLPIRIRSLQNFKLTAANVRLLLLDCLTYNLQTVILDSLSPILGLDSENDAALVTPALKHLQILTRRGITVIVIAHNKKPNPKFPAGGGADIRGSSAIFASVDAQITLTPLADYQLKVSQHKQRYSHAHEPFVLQAASPKDPYFSFEYIGTAQEATKRDDDICAAILELLGTHGKLNQLQLLSKLKDAGSKTNNKKLPELLQRLKTKEQIVDAPSDYGNSKYYELKATKV